MQQRVSQIGVVVGELIEGYDDAVAGSKIDDGGCHLDPFHVDGEGAEARIEASLAGVDGCVECADSEREHEGDEQAWNFHCITIGLVKDLAAQGIRWLG